MALCELWRPELRYYVGLVLVFPALLIGIVGFAWVFRDSIARFFIEATKGELTSQTVLAISIPLGTLLPIMFGFVKALDICIERVSEYRTSKAKHDLMEAIRTSARYDIIEDKDWRHIYELKRDGLVEIEFTPLEDEPSKGTWVAKLT